MTLPAERIVAGVVLSERVSAGVYGVLFRAQYQGQRDVRALLIDTRLLDENSFRATLSDERAMALLTELAHPTILPILAVESEGADMIVVTRGLGRYVTVYDMLSQARARGDKLATDVALAIATAVVHGLATAHRHGIVHGGIHPRSVLIDQAGGVHITDFAVGRALTTAVARGADAALWRGLSGFLAPELVLGDEPSPATDVFAAGAMLGCLLTGDLPVTEASVLPDDALGELCRRTMASDLGQRPTSGEAVAGLLRAAVFASGVTLADGAAIARAAGLVRNDKNFDDDTESLLESLGDVAQKAPMRPSIEMRAEAELLNRASGSGSSLAVQPAPPSRKPSDTGGLDALLSDLAAPAPAAAAARGPSPAAPVPVTTARSAPAPASFEPARGSSPGPFAGASSSSVSSSVSSSGSSRDTSGLDALLTDLRDSATGSADPTLDETLHSPQQSAGQHLTLEGGDDEATTLQPMPLREPPASRDVTRIGASTETAALNALMSLSMDTSATEVVAPPTAPVAAARPAVKAAAAVPATKIAVAAVTASASKPVVAGKSPEPGKQSRQQPSQPRAAASALPVPNTQVKRNPLFDDAGGDPTEREAPRNPGKLRRAAPIAEPSPFSVDTPRLTRSTWWIWVVMMVVVAVGAVFLYQRQEQKALENQQRREAEIRRAEELSKQAADALPTPGRVRMRSKPGSAGVWLSLGRTPLDSFPLSSSTLHELRVELDGFESADTQVLPGNWTGTGDERKALIALSMRPGTTKLPATPPEPVAAKGYTAGRGPIHVETTPSGAQVWLYVGVSDNMELGGIQTGKEYEFLLTKDGFLPGHGKVLVEDWQDDVGKKEVVEKTIELVPVPEGAGKAP
ncbi:MAG: protein kinase [Kofleriaceae bacterium]|nr:protein kinase [Kofleriaceae bacterium]